MLVINRLTKAGNIKSLVIRVNEIVVTTRDGERITYTRNSSRQEGKQTLDI